MNDLPRLTPVIVQGKPAMEVSHNGLFVSLYHAEQLEARVKELELKIQYILNLLTSSNRGHYAGCYIHEGEDCSCNFENREEEIEEALKERK